MKNLLIKLAAVSTVIALVSGCATSIPVGVIYTGGDVNNGSTVVNANNKEVGAKTGKACMTSVLGLVAYGDNSVAAAKHDGDITNVSTIDYKVENILGAYGTYCTIVKGN